MRNFVHKLFFLKPWFYRFLEQFCWKIYKFRPQSKFVFDFSVQAGTRWAPSFMLTSNLQPHLHVSTPATKHSEENHLGRRTPPLKLNFAHKIMQKQPALYTQLRTENLSGRSLSLKTRKTSLMVDEKSRDLEKKPLKTNLQLFKTKFTHLLPKCEKINNEVIFSVKRRSRRTVLRVQNSKCHEDSKFAESKLMF